MTPFYIAIALIISIWGFFIYLNERSGWKKPKGRFPNHWRNILRKEVSFYNSLDYDEKKLFEYKVQEFLVNIKITGMETEVEPLDSMLIASSAIIPIFKFKRWKYTTLEEVLLYPRGFFMQSPLLTEDMVMLGLIGSGPMEGKMILSKEALREGFINETDKVNTAIHEFVHLIDKADGVIDGIPSKLLDRQYTIPWLDLINRKMDDISKKKSDINPYGGTNRPEFFSVASEYFFEDPQMLKDKHPELYSLLKKVFKQDLLSRKGRH
jgi:Mlc titration factor MtfA (ptsG expression regulator)